MADQNRDAQQGQRRRRRPRLNVTPRFGPLRMVMVDDVDDHYEVRVQAFVEQIDTDQEETITYDYIVHGQEQVHERLLQNGVATAVLRIPMDPDEVAVTLRLHWVHAQNVIFDLGEIDLRPEKRRVNASFEERLARNPDTKRTMRWVNGVVVAVFVLIILWFLL